MKFTRSLFLLTLGICFVFIISALPLQYVHGNWNIINIYKVKNSENFQSTKFTVPENAEKIRFTFDITVDNPSGKYVLMGTLINEDNEKWEFQETEGFTKTIEFNDVTGSINLSLLMMLAHADLTIEWFASEPENWSNANFPSDFKTIEYTSKYIILTEVFDYIIYEYLDYNIFNINIEDKYFDYKLTFTYKIMEENGISINGLKIYYKNFTDKSYHFSKDQDYKMSVSKRVNMTDGKVISILSDSSLMDNMTITYYDGKTNEIFFTSFAGVGYIPMPWKWHYTDISDYDDILNYNTNEETYSCYKFTYKGDNKNDVYYVDIKNGIYVYGKSAINMDIEKSFGKIYVIVELKKVVFWNNIEDKEILFPKETPIFLLSLQENQIVTGDSLIILGNINPVPTDNVTLIITTPVTFSNSSIKRKVMVNTNVRQNGDFNTRLNKLNNIGTWYVQALYEGNLYCKETKSENISFHVIEMDSESSEEEKTNGRGIPSFPYESIILGLIVGVLVLWMIQRRK